MPFISETTIRDLFALFATFVALLYAYIKWTHQLWKRSGIPYLEPTFPLGNLKNPFTEKSGQVVQFADWYFELKRRRHKFGGVFMFASPNFIPVDRELIRRILVKDFQYFVDRGFYVNERDDPLSLQLLALEGHKWKTLRAKLTPTFTSGKMKMMFETIAECSKPIRDVLETSFSEKRPVNMRDILGNYTIDVIGSCAFGLDCNSFKNKDSAFRKYGEAALRETGFTKMKGLFVFSFPNLARSLRMKVTKPGVTEFFTSLADETVKARQNGMNDRKDFMQLLIELKKLKDAGDDSGITMNELVAQAFIFFLAGFETSSTTGMFCMYELAENQDVQDKVREEIREVLEKHDGKVTYEAIHEMKYLTQVVEETLRKYPPLSFLNRLTMEDYQIPDTDIVLKKGTKVLISTLGLQRDPEYFPDPDKFDPDRFSDENKPKIAPFSYLPFGEGPRACIGLRFGMLQTKTGLVALLKEHRFMLNPRTQTPVEMDPGHFVLTPKGGIWLDVNRV